MTGNPNACPDCGEPAATSREGTEPGSVIYRCANGHDWTAPGEADSSMTYDPVPKLAALIDGLHDLAASGGNLAVLGEILTGPYAGLRGGLLLDEPGREHMSTEAALRELLDENARGPLPARTTCVVCGNPLPHGKCSPVIINTGYRR
jgi:hypothetical protein